MNTQHKSARSGKMFFGMVLILIGVITMLNKLGAHLPSWLISFPTFLIALGLFLGAKNQFRRPAPFILIGFGVLLLSDDIIPGLDLSDLVFPLILLVAGGFLIMSRNQNTAWRLKRKRDRYQDFWEPKSTGTDPLNPPPAGEPASGTEPGSYDQGAGNSSSTGSFSAFGTHTGGSSTDDYIDSVSVFGGVKKNITSRSFRGGEIVNFMGGAEINLTQADFTGTIELDVTQIFGGTKIVVPPHWPVHSEMSAVFGSVEDKRPLHPESTSDGKKLIIKGTSIFGGIDIRSF